MFLDNFPRNLMFDEKDCPCTEAKKHLITTTINAALCFIVVYLDSYFIQVVLVINDGQSVQF